MEMLEIQNMDAATAEIELVTVTTMSVTSTKYLLPHTQTLV